MSTPSGIDQVLMLIGYSSLATAAALTSVTRARLYAAAMKVLKAAEELPAGTTVLVDASGLSAPRVLRVARSLEALSALISDFRISARLWGLLGMWTWGSSVLRAPPADPVVKAITYTQVIVNTIYQVLENGAYLSSKGVMGWSSEKQNKAWLWSSRCWAAHVGLEFIRLAHELRIEKKPKKGTWKEKLAPGTMVKGEKAAEDAVEQGILIKDAVERKARSQRWRREVAVNAAYAPLTVHWSLENGLINSATVGVLGSIVGVINVTKLWRATA
jgi:hypothetical protein